MGRGEKPTALKIVVDVDGDSRIAKAG